MGIDGKDIPGTQVIEVPDGDGPTKWVAVGRQSDRNINPQLQEIIDGVPADLPAEFRNQARRVAEWMTALDQGDKQLLERPEVREWLGEISSLVGVVQTCKWAHPEMAPWWLKNENRVVMESVSMVLGQNGEESLTGDEESAARDNWIEWGGEMGEWRESGYNVGDRLVGEAHECDGFKFYINGKNISQALEDGRWDKAYRDLKTSGLNLALMKWVEKGIVLYFRDWDGDPETIRARLGDQGIKVGSWAQDVFRFNAAGGEELVTSSDNALAQWEIDLEQPYQAVDFLKGYLEMCTKFGKRPDRPYSTAFVYADTEAKIEKMPKLPIVRRRFG